jgi:hypothetical protein
MYDQCVDLNHTTQDKLERLAAKGIKPEEAVAAAKVEKPADPYRERKMTCVLLLI